MVLNVLLKQNSQPATSASTVQTPSAVVGLKPVSLLDQGTKDSGFYSAPLETCSRSTSIKPTRALSTEVGLGGRAVGPGTAGFLSPVCQVVSG